MPQPIIYQADRGLIEGINSAGSALSQALGQRNLEKKTKEKEDKEIERYKESGSALNEILKAIPQNASPEDYQNALTLAIQRGVPMEMVKQASDFYKPILQERAKQASAQSYMSNIFGGQGQQQPGMQNPMGMQGQLAPQPGMNQMGLPMDQGTPAYGLPQQQQQDPTALPGTQPMQPEQPQSNGINLKSITEDQITKLLASPYKQHQQLGEAALKLQEKDQKNFVEERKYHAKGAEKAQEEANEIRRSVRGKEGALRFAREAIETGETGPLSWANISKRLDIPELMNAAGTELSQAGKEFFFGNMQRVSVKAQNQWLEQRIAKLSADVGDPKIAALMKQTMLEGELDLDKAYLDAYDRLAKEDMEKHKYVKNDIEERAFKESDEQTKKILNKTSFKTRQLFEEEKGAKWLMDNALQKVPSGTMLTPKMAKVLSTKYDGNFDKAVENAKKLGYKIPTKAEAQSWQ